MPVVKFSLEAQPESGTSGMDVGWPALCEVSLTSRPLSFGAFRPGFQVCSLTVLGEAVAGHERKSGEWGLGSGAISIPYYVTWKVHFSGSRFSF